MQSVYTHSSISRRFRAAAGVAAVCLPVCLAGAQARAQQRMQRGSFLQHHIHSPRELRQQVSMNPFVSKRYVKVLNMSEAQVRQLCGDLRVTTLPKPTYLKVWFVKKTKHGEEMHYRLQYQKAGTRVYTTADGRPVMLEQCGNLVLQSSSETAVSSTLPLPVGYGSKPVSIQVLGTPLFATLPTALPGSFMATRAPSVLGAAPILPTQVLVPIAGAAFPAGWLAPLGLLPLLAIGGGSSSSGFPIATPPVEAAAFSQAPVYPITPTPVVPEPGVLTLMAGVATSGLGLACLRRLRS